MQKDLRTQIPKTKRWVKVLIVVLCITGLLAYITKCTYDGLEKDGYVFIGGWEDTPEEALREDLSREFADWGLREIISVEYPTSDMAEILYITDRDTLVRETCVKNDKGKWHVYSTDGEESLSEPEYFVLNGDPEQFLQNEYVWFYETNYVSGWKLSSVPDVLINGKATQTKTYKIVLEGVEWSIDYWWIENVDVSSEEDPVLSYNMSDSEDQP